MRSLHPLPPTSSLYSAPQISQPRTSFYLNEDYFKGLRRRTSRLQVTLNRELSNQENATEFESTSLPNSLDVMTMDDNLIEMEDLSASETTKASEQIILPSTVCFRLPSNSDDNNDNPFAFLGMAPNAIFLLNLVAIIWGTQHAVIKLVVDDTEGGAGPFTLLRFAVGAVIASLPLLKTSQAGGTGAFAEGSEDQMTQLNGSTSEQHQELQEQQLPKEDSDLTTIWRWGAEMGTWLFLGFAFQAIGLATTTAQRSGFLLYLNVKFVPFFAFLLFGRKISIPTLVSAFTAFGGTALLACDGTSWSLNQGDIWSIAAAAASAMYILRLDTASKAVGDGKSIELNAACLWVVTLFSGLWSVGTAKDVSLLIQQLNHIVTSHPLEMIYLSAVTTALANYIQTKSQKEISAERASVIYAMDPVYGAVFSNILLRETLTPVGFVGAGLITIAAATNAFLDLGATEDLNQGTTEHTNTTRKSQ